ncbi:sigma-70 family RNA polymerase sigma factor [Plebeiibacterium sediminum]|uniref:Sigma-70 family RNA polymerase sigma factor n=1 Tax=Plebeiibacterium sediminum TaxID=2992112 RepID=A0AAE3SEX4_9BACT|nr:sigma-70 family RNA polymerase sigma factor [Plebeiobacterium sediminum]MCW3786422.1 sigma-70 family RNA polymerase sigma factor [Plebeiobacterium sediminum]
MNRDLDLGIRSSAQKIYSEMYITLKYFAIRILKSEEIAEDVIQDMWLKIWTKKPSFENKPQLKSYLYQALRNTALNHIRQSNTQNLFIDQVLISELEENMYDEMIEFETLALINNALDQLSNSAKRVYEEKLNGKKYKEIAKDLDISINTVKTHITNSNQFLRKKLLPYVS